MKQWTKAALAAAMVAGAVCAGVVQAQPVYKWVDADGKTHYGSQPPPSQPGAEAMKLQGSSATSPGGKSGARAGQQYNADGTKKIPKEVEEFGEGLKKALGTVDGRQVALNCKAAVGNIHDQADTMLEVGQKNVRDGYMTQAAFDQTAPKIRAARGKYSVGDCESSTGNKRGFYQCMSNSRNHVSGCDKQFKH